MLSQILLILYYLQQENEYQEHFLGVKATGV